MNVRQDPIVFIDWPAIISTHGPTVWRTICRIVSDPETARDCYQETFLAALRASRRIQKVNNWQAMLRTIATQLAIDELRRSRRQPTVALTEAEAPSERDPLGYRELRETVRQLLCDVPPRQAEAFWLRYVEQMDVDEVAKQLRTTPANVSVLVNRAATKLSEKLGHTAYAPESWSKL